MAKWVAVVLRHLLGPQWFGGFFWVSGFSEPVVFFSNFGGVASFSVRLHSRWLHQTSSQQTMDTGD